MQDWLKKENIPFTGRMLKVKLHNLIRNEKNNERDFDR